MPVYQTHTAQEIAPLPIGASVGMRDLSAQGWGSLPALLGLYRTVGPEYLKPIQRRLQRQFGVPALPTLPMRSLPRLP